MKYLQYNFEVFLFVLYTVPECTVYTLVKKLLDINLKDKINTYSIIYLSIVFPHISILHKIPSILHDQ